MSAASRARLMHSLNFLPYGITFPSITYAGTRSSLSQSVIKKQLLTQKLHYPNYLKKALYYHELLEKGHVQSQTALAKYVGISRTKTRLILRLLKLDEKIKDFILKIDGTDPGLDFLTVYRLQPLLQVKSKERQRRKFWKMIEE